MTFLPQRLMPGLNLLCINGKSISAPHTYNRNGGDLPSKYYDPELNHRHRKSHDHGNEDSKSRRLHDEEPKKGNGIYSSLKEEVVGPALPTPEDLQLRKEQLLDDLEDADRLRKATLKSQRKLEKERLEELVPRADAGTRERKLEKRAEIKAVHRSFRDKSPEITVSDDVLMGGDDIKADLLRQKKIEQEREARRDENYRLKEAERLQRQSEMNRREQGTMDMLKKLAQERYGSSGNSGS